MQLVSITSDFGLQDYYVAELKGSILSSVPNTQIIDVSHSIDSYDIVQAALFLENVIANFPKGSIHCVAVYNYYSTNSRFIVFQHKGHFFIGPDNGVFSLMFEDLKNFEVYVPEININPKTNICDVLSNVITHIASYKLLEHIGPKADHVNIKMGIKPVVTNSQIRATILHIDHYENVLINLKRETFEELRAGRNFTLYYKQNDPVTEISDHYSDVSIGDVFAIFNKAGYLQLGVNMGKASSLLNLNKNETIQINFE